MVGPRERGLVVVRGTRAQTAARAMRVVAALADVVWVGPADGAVVSVCSRAQLRRGLGRSCDAVVLDLHSEIDGNVLGQAHGLIRGGGVLVLRLPRDPLAGRMGHWFEHHLAKTEARWEEHPIPAPPRPPCGSTDQDALVAALVRGWDSDTPGVSVVLADRGRGKSAGVGRALAALPEHTSVAICGPHPAAIQEVLAFSGRRNLGTIEPLALLERRTSGAVWNPIDVLVVDEAAQVPVPLLQAMARAVPEAHLVLATTIHGYEGTGHGFEHRVLPWLRAEERPVMVHTLAEPIRWEADDPLEQFVSAVLVLDVELNAQPPGDALPRMEMVDRDALVRDPALLRSVFGLLARAHYRTTPADLQHLLDDPDVCLHAVWKGNAVVAVGWLVADGGLDEPTIQAVARGVRPRGAALADSFVCHSGRPDAARLSMWRSVRTAVHPAQRGRGLARRLVEHEHAVHCSADLIGTMFGATPGLVRMRQALGYQVVRLGLSRSARSGVPSVVMVRPHSAAARQLVLDLREALARDLSSQLQRLTEAPGVPLSSELVAAIRADLPPPAPWTDASVRSALQRVVEGATPIDVLGDAPALWLETLTAQGVDWTDGLSTLEVCAVQGRVVDGAAWRAVAAACGIDAVPVVQRAVRRGIRAIWQRLEAGE